MSYKRVEAAFWGGELALELTRSGDTDAFAAAFYLLTGPESSRSSIGVFKLSRAGLGEALGIDTRRASKALATLSRMGFVAVDDDYRMMFVVEAARHEYGERPNVADNRVKALRKALPGLLAVCPKSLIWKDFRERYGEPWAAILPSPSEALTKPFRSPSGLVADRAPTLEARSENLESTKEDARKAPPVKAKKIADIVIDPKLLAFGFTDEDFRKRVKTCNARKKVVTWEHELSEVLAAIEEHGAEPVLELYRETFSSGNQGLYLGKLRRNGTGRKIATKHGRSTASESTAERQRRLGETREEEDCSIMRF